MQKVALQSTQSALDFGARSLSTVDSAFAKASAAQFDATAQVAGASRLVADAYSGASSSVIDSVSGFFKSALSFVGDLQSNSQTQLGNTVTALNTIAKENSTSADQRVAQVSTDAIRYVVYGVAALAAAGALFAIFRSR